MLNEVRDPVHGFVLYDELERDLINSRPFQRLRRIKQLALTNLVYPGAVHTRFEHSLGVMEVASQLFDTVVRKGGYALLEALGIERESERERLRRVVRVAALLHDLGHPPFSHAPENLLPGGHEALTAKLIRDTEVRSIIEDEHYRAGIRVEEDIVPVAVDARFANVPLSAKHQFLTDLITGVFGADRMDYLLRDSLHTGVKYGEFDLHRLVHTLTFARSPETGDPVVALEAGGVHAAGGLILARYFMFQQVYHHPVRRIYDHHLRQALQDLLPGQAWPVEAEEYLKWNDCNAEALILEAASGRSRWARIIAERQHFKVAFAAPEADVQSDEGRYEELGRVLQDKFGDDVHVDMENRPLIRDRELTLPVLRGSRYSSWARESSLFRVLPPLAFFRVYASRDEKLVKAVREVCDEFLS